MEKTSFRPEMVTKMQTVVTRSAETTTTSDWKQALPVLTGSLPATNTSGVVAVTVLATCTPMLLVTITATCRRTRSAVSAANRLS